MISSHEFLKLADRLLDRNLDDDSDGIQLEAVTQPSHSILQLVAGPGSGKTSVLVLRALYLVFVEQVFPEKILLTTFTRRAARELRSRWLEWGQLLQGEIATAHDLSNIDLNRCQIDTLDSIIHAVLSDFRTTEVTAPDVSDETASKLLLKRQFFQSTYYAQKEALDPFLAQYTFEGRAPRNQAEALATMKTLIERLVQDRVDLIRYSDAGEAERTAVEILKSYRLNAIETNTFDYATLQEYFLSRLVDGMLGDWTGQLEALLIDEYQDTNPLQEAIYFAIMIASRPTVTVVGDDDQAMYRFRGGSVELFTDFASRCNGATGRLVSRLDMVKNYRSRPEIVEFVNGHISLDSSFQGARVQPPKPPISATRLSEGIPVLGMFRPDEATLASDLSDLLQELLTHRSIRLGSSNFQISLPAQGNLGDFVLLAHSVNEVDFARYNAELVTRFPGLLRNAMDQRGMQIFNPRGQSLRSLENVGIMLGLLLHAIDPGGTTVSDMKLTNEACFFLDQWRTRAGQFLNSGLASPLDENLARFIKGWQSVSRGNVADGSLSEFPVLELLFTIMSFLPVFQREPEHQVWLESIARVIAGSVSASPYGMRLLQNVGAKNNGVHVKRSRESLIRDALVPIAEDDVQVDEDIMPSVPRDRLQLMTVHQAKGLEFPLVIVDVGTRFRIDHAKQRFRRFPDGMSNVVIAEDHLEPYLPGPLRGHRPGIDRTFDDLIRLFYVAYSRAQCVLLLIGHENQLGYRTNVRNIALGWDRHGNWTWQQEYDGNRPPVLVDTPFLEV